MQEFQHKRKIKSWFYSKTVIGILLLVLIYAIWGTIGAYSKKSESNKNLQKTLSDYQDITNRTKSIQYSVDRLFTTNGIEQEIQEKFNVVKDGEKIAIVVDDNSTSSPRDTQPSGFWSKVASFLGSMFK